MLEIRPAEPRDLPTLIALEAASFSDPWSSRTLRLLLDEVEARKFEGEASFTRPLILIASEPASDSSSEPQDEKALGYAICRVVLDVWELQRIGVLPEARRRGVGARILDQVIGQAKRSGASCLQLEVRENNEPARALYQSRGFVPNGRRPNYYGQGVDAILGALEFPGSENPADMRQK